MLSSRKQLKGVVLKSKMDKTAVVEVSRRVPHPVYKKYILKTKKYYAHDPNNSSKTGDSVIIVESRPNSKMKKWFLKEIVNDKGAK